MVKRSFERQIIDFLKFCSVQFRFNYCDLLQTMWWSNQLFCIFHFSSCSPRTDLWSPSFSSPKQKRRYQIKRNRSTKIRVQMCEEEVQQLPDGTQVRRTKTRTVNVQQSSKHVSCEMTEWQLRPSRYSKATNTRMAPALSPFLTLLLPAIGQSIVFSTWSACFHKWMRWTGEQHKTSNRSYYFFTFISFIFYGVRWISYVGQNHLTSPIEAKRIICRISSLHYDKQSYRILNYTYLVVKVTISTRGGGCPSFTRTFADRTRYTRLTILISVMLTHLTLHTTYWINPKQNKLRGGNDDEEESTTDFFGSDPFERLVIALQWTGPFRLATRSCLIVRVNISLFRLRRREQFTKALEPAEPSSPGEFFTVINCSKSW